MIHAAPLLLMIENTDSYLIWGYSKYLFQLLLLSESEEGYCGDIQKRQMIQAISISPTASAPFSYVCMCWHLRTMLCNLTRVR